jgi:molecular chaperone GrpE
MENKETEIGLDLTSENEIKLEDNPRLEVSLLTKQLEEQNDKYLRLLAEFDNYKKRVIKEKEDLKIQTKTGILNGVLDLDSDLSHALNHNLITKDYNYYYLNFKIFLKHKE